MCQLPKRGKSLWKERHQKPRSSKSSLPMLAPKKNQYWSRP